MTISLPLYVHYVASSDSTSKTGLTVTVDVWRVTKSTLAASEIVTAGACTEIGDGVYGYLVSGADPSLYDYVPVFKTADTTVRSKHLAAVRWDAAEIWAANLAYLDALITSRAAAADYTAPRAAKLDNLDAVISSRAAPGAAMDLVTDAVTEIVAGVWNAILSGYLLPGSTGEALDTASAAGITAADVWSYAGTYGRTLTMSAAAASAALSGTTWSIKRGDTLAQAFTGLQSNTGYTTIDLIVKHDKSDADNDAVLWIRKNASGLDDGLLRLNGAAATAGDGSLTINSATSITVNLLAADTAGLVPATGLYYAFQYIVGGVVTEYVEGKCNVSADVVKAVA